MVDATLVLVVSMVMVLVLLQSLADDDDDDDDDDNDDDDDDEDHGKISFGKRKMASLRSILSNFRPNLSNPRDFSAV